MTKLKALIFDVDGVFAETEAWGHRIAFNKVFAEENLGIEWDIDTYGEKLKIAGGKERMRPIIFDPCFKKDVGDKEEYLKKLHKRKTDIYMEIIENGLLEPRSGVKRLIKEASQNKLKLGVASTSNERGVTLLIKRVLGEDIYKLFDVILAGDIVKNKKPDPEIYLLAAKKLNVQQSCCVVIEDTQNGLLAAKKALMKCIITKSEYSKNEDFSLADLVVNELGDDENTGVTIKKLKTLF